MSTIHHCAGVVHRSKSRSFSISGAVRHLYGYKRYHCAGCGFHGWLRAEDPPVQMLVWRGRLHAAVGAAVAIVVTTGLTIILSSVV